MFKEVNGVTGFVPPLLERKKELQEGKPSRAEWRRIKPSQVKMIMQAETRLELSLAWRPGVPPPLTLTT